MFSTLGRALPIEIRVNVKARRPRLKAARAPLKLDKITIKLGLNLASAVDHLASSPAMFGLLTQGISKSGYYLSLFEMADIPFSLWE